MVRRICASYSMVCAYEWENKARALASGLSPARMQNHTITVLLQSIHVHFVHYEIFDVKHWNIRDNWGSFPSNNSKNKIEKNTQYQQKILKPVNELARYIMVLIVYVSSECSVTNLRK